MVTVNPSGTTTYTVRAEGPGQCAASADATTKITIKSRSISLGPTLLKAPCNDGQARGVFNLTLNGDTTAQNIDWWVSYVNDPASGPFKVDKAHDRYHVPSNNDMTLSCVPQDSVEVWAEVTDGCSSPDTITSNHVTYLVPTYDPDTGVCTPVP